MPTTTPNRSTAAAAAAEPRARRSSGKRTTFVNVNRESQIQVTTAREGDGSIDPSGILFLQPGWNAIDAEVWERAKKQESVRRLLEAKIPPANAPEDNPERVGRPYIEEGATVDAEGPLMGVSESDALKIVAETFHVPTLERFVAEDNRPTVLRALTAAIERIQKPKRDKAASS